MAYQLALVDFDGTLVESMDYWLSLPYVTIKEANIPEPEGFRDYIRSIPLWEVGAQMEKDYPFLLQNGQSVPELCAADSHGMSQFRLWREKFCMSVESIAHSL